MKSETPQNPNMPLGKQNYLLIAVGMAVIIIGFLLLAGGGSDDPNVFNYDMFSTRRIVVAPLVLLSGFGFIIYAIMKKPKPNNK